MLYDLLIICRAFKNIGAKNVYLFISPHLRQILFYLFKNILTLFWILTKERKQRGRSIITSSKLGGSERSGDNGQF